jgi:hypothetical protein
MGILQMMPPQQQFHSQKPEKITRGQISSVRMMAEPHPRFFAAEQRCTNTALCQYTVMVKQPVQVPLSFWMFSADFLPQTLQNFPLVILNTTFNIRNNVMKNNAYAGKIGIRNCPIM